MTSRVWITTRFLLFGVLGFVVAFYCLTGIVVHFTEPVIRDTFPSIWYLLPIAVLAVLMTLFGVGAWGRWAYLWVLASIPGGLAVGLLLTWLEEKVGWESEAKISIPLLLSLVLIPLATSTAVRRYYRSQNPNDVRSAAINRQ